MKHFDWKKMLPYVVAVVLFITFAILYCSPILEGKVLQAGDVNNWKGAAQEAIEYKQKTGENTLWTNSMFGGMPSYQITGSTPANKFVGKVKDVLHCGFSDDYECVGILMGYMIGFFLMLICFGINPWLSLIGALALTLSSYFMLIIPAGHITKANALGFLGAFFGGIYAIFHRKYLLGFAVATLAGIVGIASHVQMSYYFAMLIGICCLCEVFMHIKERRWKDLSIAIGTICIVLVFVFGSKLTWWQVNQSYLKETMRGGHSELTQADVDKSQPAGLDIDYVTAWSYGKAETFTFLIPNFMGGASGYDLGKDSQLEKGLKKVGVPARQAKGFCQSAPTYWGEKPFTSGPVYMGAIICFLFILGLIIVPGPYKWALLAATIFSILLAWGRNFMPFTEFFFNYFPMYNKFRAVESILVVAEITMPLLGILALQRIVTAEDKKQYLKPMYIAGGITLGLCLFFALFGGVMNVTSSYDAQWKGQVGEDIYQMILDQRVAMLKADAWRSFIFIALAAALLWFYTQKNFKKAYLYLGLGALILADMVPVDRRFFNKDNFVSKKDDARYFAIQPWEEQILQDKSLDYRVLNLAANTFNDSRTSYRLKSVGGYSAVKLRRYQDLIDAHISQNNWNVLNMLNTKYIITRDGLVYPNQQAFGNAWFVDSLVCVNTPDAESEALNTLDLRHVAVTDISFAANKGLETKNLCGGISSIEMSDYQPNRLTYQITTDSERMVVFSEIYYPHDWHLYIDGEESPIYRVNYTLRAALIPQGKHELVMEFVPAALKTDKWCMAILIVAIVLSLAALCLHLFGKKSTCCPSVAESK